MPTPSCAHHRTQLIAKDSEAQYVECLDCGAILEAGELDQPHEERESRADRKTGAGFDESLSDA
jgi:transcription initiation factor TFIIIB Brf1 subunit/transcription initiation factor TFIIB